MQMAPRGAPWLAGPTATLLALVVASCGAAATPAPPGQAATAPPGPPTLPQGTRLADANGADRPSVLFTRQSYQDPMAENSEAIVFLLPEGWQATASVQWLPEWQRLAHLQTTIFDPATATTIDWLPLQNFIYFDPPAGFSVPIGGNYQGKAYVPPITDPAAFVSNFWMPNVLSHLQNATLVSVTQVKPIADEYVRQFGGPAQAAAYRLRYAYQQDGRAWEEDVSFALLFAGGSGITSWYVNFAYTVRAPQGELDRHVNLVSTVIASRVTTPRWEAIYRLVQGLFTRGIQQQMADTQAFARQLAQYRAETAALQDQVTQERQASQDRIADLRGQVLSGVDTYIDPVNRGLVQLPTGWNDYWVNDRGQYLASDPGVDPNSIGFGGWLRLQIRR